MAMLVPGLLLAGTNLRLPAQVTTEQLAEHQHLAQKAEASQDFATAIHEYELLVHWLPKNGEVESNLGVALYFHHDFEKAAEVFRRAIALKQSLYAPHLFLGLTMAQLSKPDAAVMELEKAVAINGSDSLAHIWLGYEYTAQSRYEPAIQQLEIAAQEKPSDPDIWYALGQCYLELGKTATTRLLQAVPDGGRAWQLAGEQFELQGNNGKALNLYVGAFKRRPDIESLRAKILALGGGLPEGNREMTASSAEEDRLYERVKEYGRKAKDAFEHVSQIDPGSYRVHQIMGDSYAAADRFDDAIQEYKQVLQAKPALPGIHGAVCNAMSRTAKVQEAIKECEAEIVISPYSAEAYVEAARVHLLVEDDVWAAALLEKAVTLDRPPAALYKLLGKLYLRQEKYQAAVKALNRYLAFESKDASAYYLLARACKHSGDTVEMNKAIAAYKRTSDAAKDTSEAQKTLDIASRDEEAQKEAREF